MSVSLKPLTDRFEQILRPIPKLPTKWRKSLADNMWWIVAVASACLALATFSFAFSAISSILMLSTSVDSFGYYVPVGRSIKYVWLGGIAMVETLSMTILTALSIKKLKTCQPTGWALTFLALLVGFVVTIVNIFIYKDWGNLIFSLVSIAVGIYLMFEVKSYFHPHRIRRKKS